MKEIGGTKRAKAEVNTYMQTVGYTKASSKTTQKMALASRSSTMDLTIVAGGALARSTERGKSQRRMARRNVAHGPTIE